MAPATNIQILSNCAATFFEALGIRNELEPRRGTEGCCQYGFFGLKATHRAAKGSIQVEAVQAQPLWHQFWLGRGEHVAFEPGNVVIFVEILVADGFRLSFSYTITMTRNRARGCKCKGVQLRTIRARILTRRICCSL